MMEFFLGTSLGRWILVIVTLSAIFYGGYRYIEYQSDQIDTLKTNATKLENAVNDQKKTMEGMTTDIGDIKTSYKSIQKDVETVVKNESDLRDKFSKPGINGRRDIGKIGEEHPEVLEKVVNNAIKFRKRCLEIASGAVVTDQERKVTKSARNTVCPSLIGYE